MTSSPKKRSRGRPRKVEIPGVDAAQVPRGIYWHARGRYWYTSNGNIAKRIAGPDAKLSDLHRIVEEAEITNRGTLGWLLELFHDSDQFKGYEVRTQENFGYLRHAANEYPSKLGGKLSDARLAAITRPGIQRMVTDIGKKYPVKAKHVLQYLRIAFRWALNWGHAPGAWEKVNPAEGVAPPKHKARVKVPTSIDHDSTIAALKKAGALGRNKGAVAPYLWVVLELAYLCRLRQIEILEMSDDCILKDGVRARRRKGSNDTIVAWSPRLRAAVTEAHRLRAKVWEGRVEPKLPEDRPLLVNERGTRMNRSSLNSAWARAKKVTGANWGLHAMKHRGVTDTPGTKADKQLASGHKESRMVDIYDHDVATVSTPKGV